MCCTKINEQVRQHPATNTKSHQHSKRETSARRLCATADSQQSLLHNGLAGTGQRPREHMRNCFVDTASVRTVMWQTGSDRHSETNLSVASGV